MAERDAGNDAGKAGLLVGGAALVTAAIALAKSRMAQAAPGVPGTPGVPGEGVVLDEATLNLLAAMAQVGANIEELTAEVLDSIQGLSLAVVPNADTITAGRILIVALNNSYQLPYILIPDDMELQIKGWPTNGGIIYVSYSNSAARNINQVWPLLANEAIGYRIKNANELWVSGTAAGDWAVFTVEQRRR